ncbi:hypothetical protein, partial [Sphaerochaeta sp. S2]|uniref:hypothetical protein n=1 Tax=Sphaerochaeta sp. S2 TaxID=2798868 RepID=UPI0018E915F3
TKDIQFDYVIANNREVSKEVKERYERESSKLLTINKKDRNLFKELGIEIIESDFIEVKRGYVRHDVKKVTDYISANISIG